MYVRRFQNVVLRCPTPRLHCFLSSHWPSFRFLSFMAFLISSIQFFFGLPRALFCFGIHFNAILDNLPSAILWTWPYNVSWFCSISFIIGSSNPICCLIVTFVILSVINVKWKEWMFIVNKLKPSLPLYCLTPCQCVAESEVSSNAATRRNEAEYSNPHVCRWCNDMPAVPNGWVITNWLGKMCREVVLT